MNYNRIILVGRLTKDPDVRSTASGIPVTTFRIAVDRPQSNESRQQNAPKETDFIDIVTFRNQAEFAANYLTKGKLILCEGRLQLREYVNEADGQRRKIAEVVADTVRFMEKRGDEGGGDAYDDGGGQRGGYNQDRGGGGYERNQDRGGGYDRQAAPAPARSGNQGGGQARGGSRNAPPQNNSFDDDDMGDPFAE
jgi:single-strand DNA-binding protein